MPALPFRPFLLAPLTAIVALASGCADEASTLEAAAPLVCAEPGSCTVSASAGQTCALMGDGTVACWGYNAYGQIGQPVDANLLSSQPFAARVEGVDDAVAVAVGDTRSCALLADGSATCWGSQNTHDPERHRPRAVPALSGARSIAAGGRYACALVADQPACWGSLTAFGHYAPRGSVEAVPIPLEGATEIAIGDHHACALVDDGTVACWGYGEEGQLGRGPTDDAYHEPEVVPGLEGAIAVAATSNYACALLDEGLVMCWGSFDDGSGVVEELDEPTIVGWRSGADELVVGRTGLCVRADGEAWCRGSVVEPQAPPKTTFVSTELVAAPALSDVDSLSIASQHLCTAGRDGLFRCWGANAHHQLGAELPSGVSTSSPVLVRTE